MSNTVRPLEVILADAKAAIAELNELEKAAAEQADRLARFEQLMDDHAAGRISTRDFLALTSGNR